MADGLPDWCMGYPATASPAPLHVVTGFHFEADELAAAAEHFTRIPMTVYRDARGRWSVTTKESLNAEPHREDAGP